MKGETNSLKNSWFTSSFAASKSDILKIASRIQEDLWTSQQEVVIRPFQNYRQLGVMVDGRPLFHERRAFFYEGELLSEAWYWSSCRDLVEGDPTLDKNKYWSTVGEAISRVKHLAPFLVIDFAEYPDGSWGVVELNSGPMTGLSDNSPLELWSNFYKIASASS